MAIPQLVIVDDDQAFCSLVTGMAERRGISATGMHSLGHAGPWLDAHDPELLLLDLGLPDGSGLDVLARISRQPARNGKIVVITGASDQSTLGRARAFGPDECLLKPLPPARLEGWLDRLAANTATVGEPTLIHAKGLIGDSEAMVRLREEIELVGPSLATVLVLGETGSGKEQVARAIHAASGRTGRFVALNCGGVAEELLASQLFGHERGSFTGAERRHTGLFEQAAGGTLFLDEIGDMPQRLQAYLLRAIENRSFCRVGGSAELPVTARIVAATHRRPDDGAWLRTDLYYRLADYPIELPPLREHLQDLPQLAQHFLAQANAEQGTTRMLDPAWLDSLMHYPWPGNVRELRAVVRRAFLHSREGRVRLEGPVARAHPPQQSLQGVVIPATASLRQAECQLIGAALARHGGNRTAAARTLGIAARTIHNHLARCDRHDDDR